MGVTEKSKNVRDQESRYGGGGPKIKRRKMKDISSSYSSEKQWNLIEKICKQLC